jgi:hypothetical protein
MDIIRIIILRTAKLQTWASLGKTVIKNVHVSGLYPSESKNSLCLGTRNKKIETYRARGKI